MTTQLGAPLQQSAGRRPPDPLTTGVTMTDQQTDLRDRIAAERSERYAMAIHDAMEPDLSLVDQEPGAQALFARAAEAATALADSEQVELRRKLVAAERIRENADFHLGQEMARRQLAEKETARLRADRAVVLNAVAQHLYTALFPAVYNDLGQKAAEGVNRAATELRRLAAEAQATTEPQSVSCAHCGKTIRRITGTLAVWWVHDPGGHTICHPQQAATSPRATPQPAAEQQPAVADTGEETNA